MGHTSSQIPSVSLTLPRTMAAGQSALYVTQAQFEALSMVNQDLRLERTAAGELIVNPPTGGETGYRNIKIAYFLVKWIEEQGGSGIAFDSSTGFRLPNGADRSPDAAWLEQASWNSLSPQQRQGFVPLCPDFVIELRSESDRLAPLQAKMQEYIVNGAKLGWLIDPHNQRIEIYRCGREMEILENPGHLSGENVLPGFVLDLNRVWA